MVSQARTIPRPRRLCTAVCLAFGLGVAGSATPDVTGKLCNRYTYRLSVNISQNTKAAAEIAAETGARRWTTIGADYTFGHQSWEFFGDYLKELDPEVELMERTAFPRFGNEGFTPSINNVMDADPEGVLVLLWGGDLVNFLQKGQVAYAGTTAELRENPDLQERYLSMA